MDQSYAGLRRRHADDAEQGGGLLAGHGHRAPRQEALPAGAASRAGARRRRQQALPPPHPRAR
eukprot:998766-Prorocentrum_minimum.AAC.1